MFTSTHETQVNRRYWASETEDVRLIGKAAAHGGCGGRKHRLIDKACRKLRMRGGAFAAVLVLALAPKELHTHLYFLAGLQIRFAEAR